MPLTPTALKLHPSRDLRIALNEFISISAQDDLVRRRLVIPLISKREVDLDLGDGANISGTDSISDAMYTAMIQSAHKRVFALSNVITGPKFMDEGLEIGFAMEFEDAKDKNLIVGSPLFPINFYKSVELYTRIPHSMLVGRRAVHVAYERLEMKMDPAVGRIAPFGMHVTGATVSHRYPKRSRYER